MLNFQDFFTACTGLWKTERIYHSVLQGEIEPSYTEYRVESLTGKQKQQFLSLLQLKVMQIDLTQATSEAIATPNSLFSS